MNTLVTNVVRVILKLLNLSVQISIALRDSRRDGASHAVLLTVVYCKLFEIAWILRNNNREREKVQCSFYLFQIDINLAFVNSNGSFVRRSVLLALNSKFCQRNHWDASSIALLTNTDCAEIELHLKAFPWSELPLTMTSSTMWKNFHLSLPGTSFSSLKGDTCMIQASTCLRLRAAARKQKTRSLFKFWWTCHSRVNIPKALDALHRNSGVVSNTKLWRAHLCWQFNWLLFEFVTTDYADIKLIACDFA